MWTARKHVSLADLLIERGWILPDDKAHVDYLLERKLQRHGGDPRASLASVNDDIKRSLAALGDEGIHHSLASLLRPDASEAAATVDFVPEGKERYSLLRLHASGGIGRIWLARDSHLERDIALKELRPERAGDSRLWARFLQEAQITGQLEHPGIVPVYELARRPGSKQPFYTMRFVRGRTLSEATLAFHAKRAVGDNDSFELLALLNAYVTVCNTIAYAHSRGVLHRDLKGQNVVLGDFGEVVVLDWGLAKRVDHDELLEQIAGGTQGGNGEPVLTLQGQALGTPAYMAPEQAAGRLDEIDFRTDVYGLGAMLYEILTGQPPFTGSDTREVLRRVREEEPPPPRQHWPAVPMELEAVCLRALCKRREDRQTAAGELGQHVQHWIAELAERKQAEQQRARFFALSVDLMCIGGFDGFLKQLNPAWEKTLGWTIEELQAKPWSEFLHPDDVAPTAAAVQKIIAGDTMLLHENRYRCKDGSYRWLHWTAQEIVGQQLIYGAARDVTDRKHAAEALRESEERYRSVIAAMQDGIVLLDSDGSIRSCNASAERILGLSADQMMGRTPLDPRWGAICADSSPFPEEARPPVVTLRTGQPCSNVIMGVRRPDGTKTWLSVNSQPLFHSDGATLAGVVACFADITDRRRTEEALRQSEALYHSLVETLPLQVWRKDRESRFTFGNQRFCEALGHPLLEVIGKTDFDFYPSKLAEKYRGDDAGVLATGMTLDTTEDHVTLKGEQLHVQVVKVPLFDAHGEIVGIQGIFWDVTERLRLQEALRQSEALYHSLVETVPLGLWRKDRDGRFTFANQRICELFGSPLSEIIGKTDFDFFAAELAEIYRSNDATVLATGKALNTTEETVTALGERLQIHVIKAPLIDAHEKIVGTQGIFWDVTERRRLQDALDQTTAELARVRQRLQ